MDTKAKSEDHGKKVRRAYTDEERRRIVEESLEPGASVSVVARRHDINANLVFTWRRQFRQGTLPSPSAAMLPVQVADVPKPAKKARKAAPKKPRPMPAPSSFVEIDLIGGHRVRVHGAPNAAVVRLVIDTLTK